MTAEDYAEAGVPVPEHMRPPVIVLESNPGSLSWVEDRFVPWCEECGDETGGCDCADGD